MAAMIVEPLVEQLHRDASAESARRIEAAKAEATRILGEANGRRASARDAAVAAATHALRTETDREAADASRQRQLRLLEVRTSVVAEVLELAGTRATTLPAHPEFPRTLQRLLVSALNYLPEGEGSVRTSPTLVQLVRDALAGAGRSGVAVTPDERLSIGVVAESGGGRVRVDATLDTLLAQSRDALAIALVRRLQDGAR